MFINVINKLFDIITVYAGVYPMDQSEHPMLRSALEKLLLNDASVESKIESRLVGN